MLLSTSIRTSSTLQSVTDKTAVPRVPFLLDSRPKILLISDDPKTISLVESSLLPTMQIQRSDSSADGVLILQQDCPDLILCDLKSEFEDLRMALRNAEYCDIPFLLFSPFQKRREKIHLLAEGVSDFLFKPAEAEELKLRVQSHLEKFRAKRLLQKELNKQNYPLDILVQELSIKSRELHRMNKIKDDFMAILSHELRNPINVISGYAEILKSDMAQAPGTREAADAIYRNAQIQTKLINDLLDISRGIAGKLVLDCKPIEIAGLLQGLIPSVQKASSQKNIDLDIHLGLNLGLINGDSTRLTQVIWNLFSNAIKFTPKNGKIDISLIRKDQWIEFAIKDSGVGIDPQFLPYMFERFHQQDRSITKNFGGLGLGLAIVRHIVELHGGSVQASSEGVGHGATFLVRLPALPN